MQTNQIPRPIIDLLQKRGITNIEDFFSTNLRELPDLLSLKDLSIASERIIRAIHNNEKIGVYGDYDVDGTTSCALLFHFFKLIGVEITCVQPSRFIEGYGIHPPSIEQAIEQNIKVLITVDCGITNNETADYASERDIDLIITDHHKDAREEMPNAFAVINPNRRDEDLESPLTALAGVGVAFALGLQIKNDLEKAGKKTPSIYPLLQFVAVGTICDLAKLNSMNLKLSRHGLQQIPTSTYPGIRAFFTPEERNAGFIPSDKISFNVGPLINSKGRLDHPQKALQLLCADDSDIAFECYSILEISNNERKNIQREVFEEAIEFIEKEELEEEIIQVVYQPHWHEGVIGIVASKLVETYKVPALVFTNASDEGIIKASVRSAGVLNIFDALKSCEDLFIKFGGHKAAAGLSMPRENLPILKEKLNEYLKDIPEISRTQLRRVDLDLPAKEITPRLAKSLEHLGPFGIGNEKPIFKFTQLKLESYNVMKDVHVRWNFSGGGIKFKGISFNYLNNNQKIHPEEIFNQQGKRDNDLVVYGSLGINRWKGQEFIQIMVDEIALTPFQ